jgi:hypothetical protein
VVYPFSSPYYFYTRDGFLSPCIVQCSVESLCHEDIKDRGERASMSKASGGSKKEVGWSLTRGAIQGVEKHAATHLRN